MTLPQGNGAPAVPTAQRVLFDWDPSFNPYLDRAGGIALTNSGVTFGVQRGQVCGVFDGSSYLYSSEAPFAALSDLTGGASIYVVCERTDAAADAAYMIGIDQAAGAAQRNDIALGCNSDNSISLAVSDDGGQELDTQAASASTDRNQINFLSGHLTTSTLTARVAGTSSGSTTVASAPHDPASLDRVTIGVQTIFASLLKYWTGRIYRILVIEGDYEAAVLSYLQGAYEDRSAPSAESLASAPDQSLLEWGWHYPDDGETSAYAGPAPTAATANLVEVTLGSLTGIQQSGDPDGLSADLSAIRSTNLPVGTYSLHVLFHQPTGTNDGGGNYMAWVGSSGTEFVTCGGSYVEGNPAYGLPRMTYDSAAVGTTNRTGTNAAFTGNEWYVVGVLIEVTSASAWRVELYENGVEKTSAAASIAGVTPVVDEIQVLTPGNVQSSTKGVVATQLWYADEGGTSLDSTHMSDVATFLLGLAS